MIGGGPGSFIGPVHRMAAERGADIRLIAGVFSRDPGRNAEAAAKWDVAPDRLYPDYERLIEGETSRHDGAHFLTIVTPNHLHFDIAAAALRAGMHVLCDKPPTLDLEQAVALAEVVRSSQRLYGLTYTYTGYPMIREAREIIRGGELGRVRKVVIEYAQGWLSQPVERDGNKQAEWRLDPRRAGIGGCIADIGVHAFNLVEFVTGERVSNLCADLAAVLPGRALDDDCNVLLRFASGARGILIASQIASGARNNLQIRVHCEAGSLSWSHERHGELVIDWRDRPTQIWHAAAAYLRLGGRSASRLPEGHPEGFVEALGNIYTDFAAAIIEGRPSAFPVPDIQEGIRSMQFVEYAVGANQAGAPWTALEDIHAENA